MRLILLAFWGCVSGCAFPVYKAYDGPERPPSEIVTFNTTKKIFRTNIVIASVDDRPVDRLTNWVAVSPGAHWYQVTVERLNKLSLLAAIIMMPPSSYVSEVCGFSLESAPGALYKFVGIDSGVSVPPDQPKIYRALLEFEERVSGGDPVILQIPSECARWDLFLEGRFKFRDDFHAKGGYLCRGDSDCLVKGATCNLDTGFSFDVCRKP